MNGRVLSIQSHVVSGYVGNKSAVFPLQLLGYDVDFINTVHFSNHTGYPKVAGSRLEGSELVALVESMELNGLLSNYTHLLTGYIGRVSFTQSLIEVVKKLKSLNPDLIYVCDPVLGDDSKLYVPKELIPLYRDELLPLADVITPNDFEVEQLTGIKIRTIEDIENALDILHGYGVLYVIITSTQLTPSNLTLVGSTKGQPPFQITFPKKDVSFTGTGDLFAALTCAYMGNMGLESQRKRSLDEVCLMALNTMQGVIERTLSLSDALANENSTLTDKLRASELKIVQSKAIFEHPSIIYTTAPLRKS